VAIDWDGLVLAPMMDAGVFGEDVQPTYMPAAGGAFPLDGIFDDAYHSVAELGDGFGDSQTTKPVLGVRQAQFPIDPSTGQPLVPISGDKVFIASVSKTYIVNTVHPDSHGGFKLELNVTA
jgi:hypothetical protein